MKSELSGFTTSELEAEIARRRYRDEDDPPIRNCDECRHFMAWTGDAGAMPGDYNPCARGHRMSFRMPTTPMSLNWGFHKRHCKDRG